MSILLTIVLLVFENGVMNVVTAQSVAQRRTIMPTFTIDNDNNITAHGTPEEAADQLRREVMTPRSSGPGGELPRSAFNRGKLIQPPLEG